MLTYQQSEEVCLELFTNVGGGAEGSWGVGGVGGRQGRAGLHGVVQLVSPGPPPIPGSTWVAPKRPFWGCAAERMQRRLCVCVCALPPGPACARCAPPQEVPEDCTVGYHVDFVWRGTSFDRMRAALNTFRKYSASISGAARARAKKARITCVLGAGDCGSARVRGPERAARGRRLPAPSNARVCVPCL